MISMGYTLIKQSKYNEALKYHNDALKILRNIFNDDFNAETASSLYLLNLKIILLNILWMNGNSIGWVLGD